MKRQRENRVSLREWPGLSDNAANHIAGGFDNRSGVRVTGDVKLPNKSLAVKM